MPLSEEELNQLTNALMGRVTEKLEDYNQEVTRMVSGAIKRIKSEGIDPLAQQVSEITENLGSVVQNSVGTQLNSLLEELAEDDDDTDDSSYESSAPNLDQLLDTKLEAFRAEQEKTTRRLQQAEQLLQQAEQEKQQLAQQQRQERMDGQVLDVIRQYVDPGQERRVLQLLKAEQKLAEQEDGYRLPGKDKYGEEIFLPVEQGIKDLIQQEYPHFLPRRGGTGTGVTPGISSTASAYSSRPQILHEQSSPDEMLAIASDESKFAEATAQLEQMIKG